MSTNQIRDVANALRFMSNRYSSDNPYGGDYNRSDSTSRNTDVSRTNENPERFLTQPYNPFELVDGAVSRVRQANQDMLSLGNQSRNDELSRQRTVQAAKDDSATRQNREAVYKTQQEANINNDAYARKLQIEQSARPVTISNSNRYQVLDDATIAHNRQVEMAKLQQYHNNANAQRDSYNQRVDDQMRRSSDIQASAINYERSMNQAAAQNAAQERLARINQQTTILGNAAGESGWRWF